MDIIPKPYKITTKEGAFSLSDASAVVLDVSCGIDDLETSRLIRGEIEKSAGIDLPVIKGYQCPSGGIRLINNGSGDEAYELAVSEDKIEITGGTAGLFYGAQTLRQLLRNGTLLIPCMHIEDRPHFQYRGFFTDVSRGKVPSLNTLLELVDRISFYKINQLQLYVEHTFAFKGMSEVWMGADPLTAEEILALDEYCRKRHIELVPSMASFGHMYAILSSNSYKHLCELDNSGEQPYSAIDRMNHHTLDASNPESIELIEKMIREFAPLFTSKLFNINCDETFDLGKGRSGPLVQAKGRGRVYLGFISRIADIVKRYGKQAVCWGDIILQYPELLRDMPGDIIVLNWSYGPNPSEENIRLIAETGLKQCVCPGVSGWKRLINDFDTSVTNIRRMAAYGQKYGALGLLNTDWGDFGHINMFAGSMPGMIYGANFSWNPADIRSDIQINNAVSQVEYGSVRLMELLRELGRLQPCRWEHIVIWYEAGLFNNPGICGLENVLDISGDEEFNNAYRRALEIEKELTGILPSVRRDRRTDMQEFCCAARGIALMNAFAVAVKRFGYKQDVKLALAPGELAEELEYWFTVFARLWRIRNKESELNWILNIIKSMCSFLRKAE